MIKGMVVSGMEQRAPVEKSPRWLSLGQASGLLGINQVTLRHWANKGQIRSFRTPGGHRRFSVEDIYNLIHSELPIYRGDGYQEVREKAIAGVRRRLRHARGQPSLRHLALDEQERTQMRLWGRRLIELVTEYLAHPRNRARLMEEARGIGESYGQEAARNGMSMVGMIEAFLFFRHSLEDIAKGLINGESPQDETSRIWQRINNLMEQVLLAAAAGYEEAAAPSPKASVHS